MRYSAQPPQLYAWRAPKPPPSSIMSIRVYSVDSNPAIDPFSFKLSDKRAAALVASKTGSFIRLACGRIAIKMLPQRHYPSDPEQLHVALFPTFDLAWGIRPSGGVPVWQMRTSR